MNNFLNPLKLIPYEVKIQKKISDALFNYMEISLNSLISVET